MSLKKGCFSIIPLSLLLIFPLSLFANSVTEFALIDADSNSEITTIQMGDTISLSPQAASTLNIQAKTDPSTVDSVSFTLSGATSANQTEGNAPYALFGDQGGNYNSGTLNPGTHTLTATPTLSGVNGTPLSVDFTLNLQSSANPVADAGKDRYLFLPDDDLTLKGSGTDPDNDIVSYQWVKTSGPNGFSMSGQNSSELMLSSLSQGKYTFRFTVTDSKGNWSNDDVNVFVIQSNETADTPQPSGEMKKWHKVTLTFTGPATSETATPNPFTNYRLDVTFVNGTNVYTVPGYFAADGDAAESSASQGDKWRVHFTPDKTGEWNYLVSFRSGNNIILSSDPNAGSAVTPLDGITGSFSIGETDKSGRDLRARGRLLYDGTRYLKFAGTGEYFLKQGADAPENFLAYDDFDNTPDNGGRRKSWGPHISDWQDGDPLWQTNKGKGIIGAINYLAAEGMNAFSFIPMNIGGDDKNVFPYISDNAADRTRIDCSKVAQWEIVFEHADKMGMFLHFKTQETENELLLDGGNMGIERTLYYRELIARFSHHLALNWNLGEEINNASTTQKKSWAQYFFENDPYNHHIVIHNMNDPHYDLLGHGSKLTGFSLQTSRSDFSSVHSRVKDYLDRSQAAGKQWAVACDEPGDASHALRPDNDAGNSHEDGRKNGLWGTFMAGGWGNEWYFGYAHDHSDLTCEDFRSRDNWWDYCRIALDFFTDFTIPFWQMENDNALSNADNDYCFFKDNDVYVIYLKEGGTTDLDLRGTTGQFSVQWYDPRNGGQLQTGSIPSVEGGSWVSLGQPPESTTSDWAILVRKEKKGDHFWLLVNPLITPAR